ncbi:Uu.00g041030.m01.CDS01 [Anthostomella pinea]|uniref:Uu.00g041030.m01.CDS01 n=1 Tax=Anthostomella pinea TaxID=933095 RepID=A0AAI8VB99_9PEZI|nr:Uu.00g041030.m01.CDS01 [Anthostomella pinea]
MPSRSNSRSNYSSDTALPRKPNYDSDESSDYGTVRYSISNSAASGSLDDSRPRRTMSAAAEKRRSSTKEGAKLYQISSTGREALKNWHESMPSVLQLNHEIARIDKQAAAPEAQGYLGPCDEREEWWNCPRAIAKLDRDHKERMATLRAVKKASDSASQSPAKKFKTLARRVVGKAIKLARGNTVPDGLIVNATPADTGLEEKPFKTCTVCFECQRQSQLVAYELYMEYMYLTHKAQAWNAYRETVREVGEGYIEWAKP